VGDAHQFLGNGVNGVNNGLNGSLMNNGLNLSMFSESMGKSKDDCHGSDLQNHLQQNLQNSQLGSQNSQNLQNSGHNQQTLLSECLILQDVLNGGPEAKIPKLEKLIQEVEKNDQNNESAADIVDDKNKPAEQDLDGSSNSKSVVVASGQEAAEHDNTQQGVEKLGDEPK